MNSSIKLERDQLIVRGVNMLRRFSELDKISMIVYAVDTTKAVEEIVVPWMKIKNDCAQWHEDIKEFCSKNKIDLALWNDLLIPPQGVHLMVTGLGAGGQYTADKIDQIEFQIKKGKVVLDKITDVTLHELGNSMKTLVYIEKNNDDYQYNGERLTFNEQTIYGNTFEIIFNFCERGGFVTYEHIEKQLQQFGHAKREGETRNTRITNALNKEQGFLKYVKINHGPFPATLPNGKKLFEIKKGRGVQFNNQKA